MDWSKARANIKHWGPGHFLYDCLMSGLKPWVTLTVVTLRPLRDETPPPLADGRRVRVASHDELMAAAGDPTHDLDPEFLREARRRGEFCVVIYEGHKLISYMWRAFGASPHEKGLWIRYSDRYAYSFKAFTHPDYRQQKLQHVASYYSDRELIRRGYQHVIGFVETHNYPSLRSARARRNEFVGYAGYLMLFGRILPFRSPGARRHGFAFYRPQRGGQQAPAME